MLSHRASCALAQNLLSRTGVWRAGCIQNVYQSSTSAADTKIDKKVKMVKEKTPVGKLDRPAEDKHRDSEKDPLPKWPGGKNPHTGERGGPAGPEPTRYGDWERKGRVTDF